MRIQREKLVAGKRRLPKRPKKLSIQKEKRKAIPKESTTYKGSKEKYRILQGANNSLWRKNTEMKPKVGQEIIMNCLVYGILRSLAS